MEEGSEGCFYCGRSETEASLETCGECGVVRFCGESHRAIHSKRRRRRTGKEERRSKSGENTGGENQEEEEERFCNKFVVKRTKVVCPQY